jgi:hypothetical protein
VDARGEEQRPERYPSVRQKTKSLRKARTLGMAQNDSVRESTFGIKGQERSIAFCCFGNIRIFRQVPTCQFSLTVNRRRTSFTLLIAAERYSKRVGGLFLGEAQPAAPIREMSLPKTPSIGLAIASESEHDC